MAHVITLAEQLKTVSESVQPLIDRPKGDDPVGALKQSKAAIAECEVLLFMLKKEQSDIEYEVLEANENPTEYWNI